MKKRMLLGCTAVIAIFAGVCEVNGQATLSDSLRIVGRGALADRTYFNSIVEGSNDFDNPNPIGNGIDQIYLPVPAGTAAPSTVTLLEQVTGGISDALVLTIIPAPIRPTEDSLIFTFTSGTNAASNGTTVTEQAGEFEITRQVFPSFVAGQEPYRVFVFSDVDNIPEPATLGLFAVGATLIFAGKRRRID